jgi:hypothetical protein
MQKSGVNRKVVLWGHPPDTHTHSYIHYGFYKSFEYLGYDVVWVDDLKKNSNIDLNDAIVISEKNVINHLPIIDSATYFIHNFKDDFEETGYDNVHNYLVYHENYSWSGVEKVDEHFWYCPRTKTPMIMWATDLLPNEIDELEPCLYDDSKDSVYFVGTIQGENAIDFAHICANNGKDFINLGGYTGYEDEEDGLNFYGYDKSIKAVIDSYISFDIREKCHLDNGYVPCRIFKNMSYGKWTGSNSQKVQKFFGDRITINGDLEKLYKSIVDDYKKSDENILRDNMNFVKNNHTYLNRINSLLSVL